MRRNKAFQALPPFLGGKRRLTDIISSHFQGETVCDIFMGGGSVALKAKLMNKRVIANDIAGRSKIVGEALIRNQKEKITIEDVYSLFIPSEHQSFIEKNYAPKIFIPKVAKFLDNAFVNARKRKSPKKELLELLLVKYILSLRQYGAFQVGMFDNKMILRGEEIQLLELASESRARKIRDGLNHALPVLLKIKDQINRAVFNNGKTNKAYQMDCFKFLELMGKQEEKIDTIYFDSPYFNSTLYSSHYKVLDEILEGRKGIEIQDKAFNSKEVLKNFERLFSLSEFIPKWIISMGYNPASEAGIKGEKLLGVVKKFREAKLYHLEHNWAINNIASKSGKKQSENVEYLIVTS